MSHNTCILLVLLERHRRSFNKRYALKIRTLSLRHWSFFNIESSQRSEFCIHASYNCSEWCIEFVSVRCHYVSVIIELNCFRYFARTHQTLPTVRVIDEKKNTWAIVIVRTANRRDSVVRRSFSKNHYPEISSRKLFKKIPPRRSIIIYLNDECKCNFQHVLFTFVSIKI